MNENTFVYYYAMGLETNGEHNAIKRQEYTTSTSASGSTMYNFRLNSYEKAGMIYLPSLTYEQYIDLQRYQDKYNKQVIYPITDYSKRPEGPAQETDANYWFETKLAEGNKSVPTNYTINEDGTVTLNNIYSPYVRNDFASKSNVGNAEICQLFEKDGGFAIGFLNDSDEGKNIEYFTYGIQENLHYATYSEDISQAIKFEYDEVHQAFTFDLEGHADATLDGKYFLGLYYERGSNIEMRPIAELGGTDYIPFTVCVGEEKDLNPQTGKDYYFEAARGKSVNDNYYAGKFNLVENQFVVDNNASSSDKYQFVSKGDDTYALQVTSGKFAQKLKVVVTGNDISFTATKATADATGWTYDAARNAIKTELTFADASLNGDYYLYYNNSTGAFGLAKADAIDASDVMFGLNVWLNSVTPATSIATSTDYVLYAPNNKTDYTYYYANGLLTGDNYISRMRIEGSEPKYAYARQTNDTFEVRVNYYEYYCYYHSQVLKDRITKPYFLFGTTANGQDIFTCLASGARFSFIMAIIVAFVNMLVGAIYGAIEGYYGGKVDLVMERIVEILSAVPFMIVITLLKYHMESSPQALILFIAFFLTGWIGMSGLVRMQFYRFKNQEYVLASRTLGARDWRIMFKHIFPNALGTIVTSCVLVIPSMIFSETSLSYLGIINLSNGDMTSVGTLLADAQGYIDTYPHMILYPAIFISLLMLSFNLFGNGLRDAFNPSLRGTED